MSEMRLSIIVAVLNSHEIVRRQLLHLYRMELPGNVEVIYMDDGSTPQLTNMGVPLRNLRILPTNEPRGIKDRKGGKFVDGRVGAARNKAAKWAKGEILLMTDIDYIIMRDSIDVGLNLQFDKAGFRREFGVLDEYANFTQDFDALRKYGLLESRIEGRGTLLAPHPNNFLMRKETFFRLGGYREDRIGWNYPDGHDRWFKRRWAELFEKGLVTIRPAEERTTLYMFPNGQYCGDIDTNPFGLFHGLSRKNNTWPPPEKRKSA